MTADLPPLDVCLTIDAEYDINDSLGKPESNTPIGYASMQRVADGRSEGLGFILEALGAHRLPATFFVEVFCAHFFGADEVKRMVTAIRSAGPHDVQLHAHPCWRYFRDPDWRQSVKAIRKNDSWAGRGDEALDMLREAVSLFGMIAGRAPQVFRSGNLQVDGDVHRALARLGIPLSSSVGLGLSLPDDERLRRWVVPTRIAGVLEVPVAAYREPGLRGGRNKCLTITGTTWAVTRRLLESAYRMQAGPVVILTHANEFADSARSGTHAATYRANPLNQGRLRQLLRFLDAQRERFNTTTFAAGAATWQAAPARDDLLFVAPRFAPLVRAAENGWARLWRNAG